MIRGKAYVGAAAVMAVALGLTACSMGEGDSADQSGSAGVPNFAFITVDISDFGQVQIEGMKSVVEPLGGTITVFDGANDPATQNSDCMDIVSSGQYNGIIVNPSSGPAAIPCVDAAREAGIPVAAVETVIGPDETKLEPQVDGVVISAVPSLQDAANATVDLVEDACADSNPCRYIHIVGSPAYQATAVQLGVFEERFGGDPRYQRVALGEDEYNPEKGRQVASELLSANPDVDVILNSSDSSAVQVIELLKELGRDDIAVLGDGGSRQGVKAIKDGTLYGTVFTVPFTFGEVAAQGLVDYNNGDPVETPEKVAERITFLTVTPENVDGIEAQWG